jgi:23S rRNA (pseudouridine1915-N3)-methyltransferase
MKITIIAGGILKTGPLQSLVKEYEKRLLWKISIVEIPENSHKNTTPLFLEKIPKDAIVIAMDERGENLSSPQLAQWIESKQVEGHSHFCFLIGTADGFDPTITPHIHKKIAFGKGTWPHLMVRVMLLEQLYRAQQIIQGHPYHRQG